MAQSAPWGSPAPWLRLFSGAGAREKAVQLQAGGEVLPLHAVFREVFFFSDSGCFPGCRVVVVCFPRITLFLARLGLNAGEMLGPTGPALQPLQVPLAVPQPALARAPQQTAHCGLSLG